MLHCNQLHNLCYNNAYLRMHFGRKFRSLRHPLFLMIFSDNKNHPLRRTENNCTINTVEDGTRSALRICHGMNVYERQVEHHERETDEKPFSRQKRACKVNADHVGLCVVWYHLDCCDGSFCSQSIWRELRSLSCQHRKRAAFCFTDVRADLYPCIFGVSTDTS